MSLLVARLTETLEGGRSGRRGKSCQVVPTKWGIPDLHVMVAWVNVVQLDSKLFTALQFLHQGGIRLLQQLRVIGSKVDEVAACM